MGFVIRDSGLLSDSYSRQADVLARGTVERTQEWMSLQPYLHAIPHDQRDLDSRVPGGTSIPVYLFPEMKGRSRVQVFDELPPAQANYRTAINALDDGLLDLALTGGVIFVLIRRRRICFEKPN